MTAQPIVVCKGVTRRFGGLVANDSVDMEVRSGEILGLIGPNGAGKSTLFNLIAGSFPVSSGVIEFDGQDIASLPAARRCQLGIARTYQVPRSFDSMSVVENVTVGAFVRYPGMMDALNKAHEVLDYVGLTPSEARAGVELIRKVRDTGVTVVMVEHVMEVVMPLVDRAVVLHLGKVLAEGKPADVVRNDDVITAYLGERHRAA